MLMWVWIFPAIVNSSGSWTVTSQKSQRGVSVPRPVTNEVAAATMSPTSVVPPRTGGAASENPVRVVPLALSDALTMSTGCRVGTPTIENVPSKPVVPVTEDADVHAGQWLEIAAHHATDYRRQRIRDDVDSNGRLTDVRAEIHGVGRERQAAGSHRRGDAELVRGGGIGEYDRTVHQEVERHDCHIVSRRRAQRDGLAFDERRAVSRSNQRDGRSDALQIFERAILSDVEARILRHSVLDDAARRGQVHVCAVDRDAGAVVVPEWEVEPRAR